MAERQKFRSPFAVVIWWVWVLFAVANLVDLAVQGRDHLSVVAAFILVLVTGVMYTTAQRPRIVADEDGLTISNPLRDHRIGWAAVAGVDAAELLRVRCEWPLDGAPGTAAETSAGTPASTGRRAIYSWAVHSSRRRQVTAQLRAERPRLRSGSLAGPAGVRHGGPGGSFGDPEPAGQPSAVVDSQQIVAAISALAGQAQAASPPRRATAPVSTWYWPAFAAIAIPALALVVAILALRPAAGFRRRTAGWTAATAASPRSRRARRP